MGSPCELHLYGPAPGEAGRVARLARAEIVRLEQKYSRYLDDSLTTRINRSAGDPAGLGVDDETASLLDYADITHRESDGRFDITSGILRRVWDFKTGRVPSRAEIAALQPQLGWSRVRWERPRIVLPVEGMELDFGGYVKEYAADRVAALCRREGIRHGLVDLGGDLAVVGPHPGGAPWRIGIRHPRRPETAMATVSLVGGAVASSGDYERCMWVDGERYSHILDPRTGWPVRGLAGVSVVASHCLVAGTTATVAMLMGEDHGPAWLDSLELRNVRMDQQQRISGNLAPRPPRRAIRGRAKSNRKARGRAASRPRPRLG